jgi:hypothetical protein
MSLTDRIDTVDVTFERASGVTPFEGVDAGPRPDASTAATVKVNRSPFGRSLISARVCRPATTTAVLGGDEVIT